LRIGEAIGCVISFTSRILTDIRTFFVRWPGRCENRPAGFDRLWTERVKDQWRHFRPCGSPS
jgi:hypothetical protein